MFVDSDDKVAPAGVDALVRHLKTNPDLDYAYGKVQMVDAEFNPMTSDQTYGGAFQKDGNGIFGYHWHTMGALYRRSCPARVGDWNVDLSGSQDWEYQARVKMYGGKGAFVDVLVGYWRQHQSGRVGASSFRPDYI